MPSDSSGANLADDELRSLKSSLAIGLSNSMYWPGSGGGSAASAGQMKPGVARTYVGTQSQVSSTNTAGSLMITSDTSRLYAVGPAGVQFLGSSRMVEFSDPPAVNKRWVMSNGTVASGAIITFPQSYDTTPTLFVSLQTTTTYPIVAFATLLGISSSTASVGVRHADTSAETDQAWTVNWVSLGTVSF